MKNIVKKVLVIASDLSLENMVGRVLKDHDPAAQLEVRSNIFEPGTYFSGIDPLQFPSLIIMVDEEKQQRVLQNVAELKSGNQTAHIPVVVVTTVGDHDYHERFYKSKVNCLLMKPQGDSTLEQILSAMLYLWVPRDSPI